MAILHKNVWICRRKTGGTGLWMKPISPCCKPEGIMIQSLFTGKDISLRKEEKCASLSQAAALASGMFGKNVWGGENRQS